MKETIMYYYNIDVDNIEENDGKYHFKYQNKDYFFVFFNRNLEELDDIVACVFNMKEKGIMVNDIILNIKGSFLTNVNGFNYILMSVVNPKEELDIFDIVSIVNKLHLNNNTSKLYRNNWKTLWMQKVDYFEYQIRELALNKSVVKDTFSYYIGLAENAISYVNNVNMKFQNIDSRVVLSHRRVFYPNYKLNFFNPLSFVFDLEVRDIAEYLKAMFFTIDTEYEVLEDLKCYLSIKRLSIYDASMLYARLLYPSYYFDIYEEVMNKDRNEEDLIKIIKKANLYEDFLKAAYLEINKYATIEKIDWIIG